MISNTTPAGGPTNVLNSEQQALQLFGPSSSSQTSAQFTVDQHPFTLSAYNLGADDVILVQQVVGYGGSTLASTYQPVYGPVQLDTHRSRATIEHPGRYRLIHTGSSSLGTFTVLGGLYSSTSSGIAELAAGLQAVITSTGVTVTGTSPVVVTGAGTPASPYVVGTPDIVVQPSGNVAVAIGHSAVAPSVGAVAIGPSARAAGITSTAIGSNAGFGGNLGGSSVAVGVSAGASLATTVIGGVFVGSTAGDTGTFTSQSPVCIGAGAGFGANVAGNFVGIGENTLAGATSAGKNIAIGQNAGINETHADIIIIASHASAVNASQANQIVLGTATQTQLVTAGSIIQGGVISASDARLKKNLEAEWEALEKINQLDPVTFEWDRVGVEEFKAVLNDSEYGKRHHGLIAQEVQDVFPEVVESINRGGGDYLCVRYDKLVTILVAALQELSAKVTALEAKQNG